MSARLWGASVLAVIAVHASLAAMLVLHLQLPASQVAPPPAAMTVEVMELPRSPPVPQTLVAPGPQRVEAKVVRQSRRTHDAPKFELPPEMKSGDVANEADAAQSQPDLPVPTTTAPASVAAKPNETLNAPVEGAPSPAPTKAEQTWEARVVAQLERHKHYPFEAERRHEEDTVYLRFSLDRRGRVLSSRIDHSAGYELLDNEVLALIQRVAPLPAPPKEVAGDPVELVVPVDFFVRK